ncbi:hypothetical protein HYPSUDRAFT_55325 [Hypholoma sublateritium FD-334 SS-4]|uniref:Uncharacterized protein n=1 Tax=Hypholoma sublateritium (strain FD-334 SS-4) TaxID=945553 RepID=A0A0D2NZD7_HYPSF|nr:hypothetical protein HYPSUDRAFT_55325 [Hypholoma sublateritium FD-334 SS-4]
MNVAQKPNWRNWRQAERKFKQDAHTAKRNPAPGMSRRYLVDHSRFKKALTVIVVGSWYTGPIGLTSAVQLRHNISTVKERERIFLATRMLTRYTGNYRLF